MSTASAVGPTGLRAVARRHPIAVYLAIVFGLGYPLMALPILADRGIIPGASLPSALGLDVEKTSALLMVLFALFPAALIVSALEGGRPAVAELLRRMRIWRIGAAWWVLVLGALPAVTVGIAVLMGDTIRPPTPSTLAAELGGFLAGLLLVNLWEEASWAGFMQTRLERRYNLYTAAALTAVPFAGIHLPLQFVAGTPTPFALLLQFVLLAVIATVVRSYFGLVLRGAANSLLAVGVAHTIFNRSNNADGIAARLLEGSHRQGAALLATLVVTVLLGLLMRRRAAS